MESFFSTPGHVSSEGQEVIRKGSQSSDEWVVRVSAFLTFKNLLGDRQLVTRISGLPF